MFVGVLGCVLVLAALVLMLLVWKPLMAAWHRHQMTRAWEETERAAQLQADPTPSYLQLEAHLEELVKLGDVSKVEYPFAHIRVPTEESKHIWKRIMAKDCPPLLNATGEHPKTPEPLVLKVWCEHEFRDEWDEFVNSIDVTDYRQRFMLDDSE